MSVAEDQGPTAAYGVHPRLSVSALSSLPWSFDQDVAYYDQAGFRQVSPSVLKLRRDGVDLVEAGRTLAAVGIAIDTVFPAGQLELRGEPGSGTDALVREVGLAAQVGARAVCITPGSAHGRPFEWARDRFLGAAEPIVAEAHRQGLAIVLEGTRPQFAHLSFLHTFRDSVSVAREVGMQVAFDTVHFWWEPGLEAQLVAAGDLLGLVQVGDLSFDGPVTERVVPGAGELGLSTMLGWTQRAGYRGPVEIEVLGPEVQRRPPGEVIEASARELDTILATLDA